MDKRKEPLKDVPEQVYDRKRGVVYTRGRFLGKGGFARCYELTDTKTNEVYAGKIVSKTLLQKPYQREKVYLYSFPMSSITDDTRSTDSSKLEPPTCS